VFRDAEYFVINVLAAGDEDITGVVERYTWTDSPTLVFHRGRYA
jgi:hypothetical protein